MTPQPDALPRCPSCGFDGPMCEGLQLIPGRPKRHFVICGNLDDCLARGPLRDTESEAMLAFTNPAHALAASRAECERLRKALEEIIKAWDHKTGDYYVDNYLSDVEIDAARAALAAQGGGT